MPFAARWRRLARGFSGRLAGSLHYRIEGALESLPSVRKLLDFLGFGLRLLSHSLSVAWWGQIRIPYRHILSLGEELRYARYRTFQLMTPAAISKAQNRLKLANDRLIEAEAAPNYVAFSGAWYSFLTAYKNVYSTLEQGAKASAKSRQWFGAKKQARKSDPMLQYLFQARDSDEHSLENVTELYHGHTSIGVSKPGYSDFMEFSEVKIRNSSITIENATSLDGKPILIERIGPHVRLRSVAGRGNIVYQPPTQHKGQKLANNLPITIGKLAIIYLDELIQEAEGLI